MRRSGTGVDRPEAGRVRVAAAALLALPGLLAPSSGAAQAEGGERGWLGVALYDALVRCGEPRTGRVECERTAVVGQVVPESPAARAGLQPGDTLLALGGREITRGAQDPAFAEMRAGRPVALRVGRREGGDRTLLTAVPAPRPSGLPDPDRGRETRTARDVVRTWAPWAVADTVGEAEGRRWITIRLDSDSIRVSPMSVEIRGRLPGDVVVPGRSGARVLVGSDAAETEGPADLRLVRVGPDLWGRLEFGPRLRALQDSVFRRAQLRFESIQARARRGEVEVRVGSGAGEGRARSERERFFGTAMFERRIAGAEFAPLNPELAEVVSGPDRGLLVLRVLPGTPASELGLRPGDVVVEAGGRSCGELGDLRSALASAEGSRGVVVKWVRKGEVLSGTVRD